MASRPKEDTEGSLEMMRTQLEIVAPELQGIN
jgi:hypothetical protein